MKDCKKIHPLLPFYIEGQLTSTEKSQVDKHLGACEIARKELEHFRHLLEGLRNLPEPEVPADLHGKIMAKLGQHPQTITPRHHLWGPQIWGLAAAAVMVFVLFNQYPNWKESWKASPPQAEQEKVSNVPQPSASPTSTNTFTATSNNYAPVPQEAGVAKMKRSSTKDKTVDLQIQTASDNKTSNTLGKTFGLAKPEEEKALSPTFGTTVDGFSNANGAGVMKHSAKKDSRKIEAAQVADAAAPAPMAALPPAPTPTIPSLDQSMRSLTYSQEQTVVTWNGNNGPSTVESQELVTDAETFQKYWQIPHPGETPPEVDFTKNAVVVLNAGEKPSAGYSIQVTRLEEKNDQLVIHYKVDVPSPVVAVAAMVTHPWVLQVIPKPSKPVVYLKDH